MVAYRAGSLQKQTLTAGPETAYDSEDAADTGALALAKQWIDEHS